ncbi:hypothetical protein AAF712_010695 [Marasmius tenuissimus]|uniref:Uncharacterized protein n=1 Tax=Marasmius tenuissimus TaxID=585030 RepID=A0ABR2ZN01_9AGAR
MQKSMGLSAGNAEAPAEAAAVNLGSFPNISVFRLMNWSSEEKDITAGSLNRLTRNVLSQPDFDPRHFDDFDTHCENKKLDKLIAAAKSSDSSKLKAIKLLLFEGNDIWRKGTISIPMLCSGWKFDSEDKAPQLVILDVWYCQPLDIIRPVVKDEEFLKFHV